LIVQAETNQSRALQILELYNQRKDWIMRQTHSQYAVRALDWFFSRPIFKTSDFIATSNIPRSTASRILREVHDAGLLVGLRPSGGRRAAVLAFSELVNIAEGNWVL